MARGKPPRGSAARAPTDNAAPTAATPSNVNGLTKASKQKNGGNGANLGFEAQLFFAADKLRKNLEPSDYKHVALGLIFLKYISNAGGNAMRRTMQAGSGFSKVERRSYFGR
jgi:hypothetical protein